MEIKPDFKLSGWVENSKGCYSCTVQRFFDLVIYKTEMSIVGYYTSGYTAMINKETLNPLFETPEDAEAGIIKILNSVCKKTLEKIK